MIDERTLRLSTNPQVQATLILIDEIRQLKSILGNSNLVFLDSATKEEVPTVDKTTTRTRKPNVVDSDKPKRGRKKVTK